MAELSMSVLPAVLRVSLERTVPQVARACTATAPRDFAEVAYASLASTPLSTVSTAIRSAHVARVSRARMELGAQEFANRVLLGTTGQHASLASVSMVSAQMVTRALGAVLRAMRGTPGRTVTYFALVRMGSALWVLMALERARAATRDSPERIANLAMSALFARIIAVPMRSALTLSLGTRVLANLAILEMDLLALM